MGRRCWGKWEQSNSRLSDCKVPPKSRRIFTFNLPNYHTVPTAAVFCSYLNTIHDTWPIQKGVRGPTVARLSWLQIRLCNITLPTCRKHKTVYCSTNSLCMYLQMCVTECISVDIMCTQWQSHWVQGYKEHLKEDKRITLIYLNHTYIHLYKASVLNIALLIEKSPSRRGW